MPRTRSARRPGFVFPRPFGLLGRPSAVKPHTPKLQLLMLESRLLPAISITPTATVRYLDGSQAQQFVVTFDYNDTYYNYNRFVDWGDDTESGYDDLYPGSSVTITHAYSSFGTFVITAEEFYGDEGDSDLQDATLIYQSLPAPAQLCPDGTCDDLADAVVPANCVPDPDQGFGLPYIPPASSDAGVKPVGPVQMPGMGPVNAAPLCPPGYTVSGMSLRSSGPVGYADGVLQFAATDIVSRGIGADAWSMTRSWRNGAGYSADSMLGDGWVATAEPRLVHVRTTVDGDDLYAVVSNGTTARYFLDDSDSTTVGRYVEAFGGQGVLRHDSAAVPTGLSSFSHDTAGHGLTDTFRLITPAGVVLTFAGFDQTTASSCGRLLGRTDPNGDTVGIGYSGDQMSAVTRAVTVGATTTTERWDYTYGSVTSTTASVQRLTEVQLSRGTSTASLTAKRTAQYAYHDGTDDSGRLGDLKTVTVHDGSATAATVGQEYYRWYTTDDSGTFGYAGGLKLYLDAASTARAAGDSVTLDGASDSTVLTYATNYFEYDAYHRVSLEHVQGAGCSVCSGGIGTYTFDYSGNGNSTAPDGPNEWVTKTVEVLPDGNRNVVYTNGSGQPILKSLQAWEGSTFNATTHQWEGGSYTGREWATFVNYDSDNHPVLVAQPSAVLGYDDAYNDLLNWTGTDYDLLDDSHGVVATATYGTSTTATDSKAGCVTGYLAGTALKHGEGDASPELQASYTYFAKTAGDYRLVLTAASTVYAGENGTGARTTDYAYTYYTSPLQVKTATTTLPGVATTQHGSGTRDTVAVEADRQGHVTWMRDQSGHLNYWRFDRVTGAAVQQIADANTSSTASFAAMPSDTTWVNTSGLQLASSSVVDWLGRPTATTDPRGTVTYAVYKDATREVRVYPAWNGSTSTPTGPVTVMRDDRAGHYAEWLTYAAIPSGTGSLTLTSGVPTGVESLTLQTLQTLGRSYVNNAGQSVRSDNYFKLSGVTYNSAKYLGTQNTNYATSLTDYDDRGRTKRTVTPLGTITRYLYDAPGRLVSTWTGTDDTPESGYWSPGNAMGGNLVMVAWNQYDRGGVGDGNLTRSVQYPGLALEPRVTDTAYDWRDRAVAVKQGVGVPAANFSASEYYSVEGQASVTVTVYLSSPSNDTISVVVSTHDSDGSAVAGTDYTATTATVTFAPGAQVATVSVPLGTDSDAVNNRFGVRLTIPDTEALKVVPGVADAGVAVLDNSVGATYVDGRLSANGYVALEGAASVTLGVVFAFTGSTTYTVTLSTNQQDGGTAVAGADYTAKLATVTSSVHVGSTTFGLTDDGLSEGNETVRAYMNYYTAGGAVAVDVPYRAWVTILDDDRETTGGLGEAASVNRPIVWTTYDNLGEVVATEQFDGDNLAIADGDGVPTKPADSLGFNRAKSTASYDDLGRVYRTDTYSVDPDTGSVSTVTLHGDTWYDPRGYAVKQASPGGLVVKRAYDGAGRLAWQAATDGGGDSSAPYVDAQTLTGDVVLAETHYDYDAAGNVLRVTTKQRFHDATDTGPLGNATSSSGTARARVSYAGMWYDLANRPTVTVNLGTNTDSVGVAGPWSWTGTPPSRSGVALRTDTSYDAAGRTYEVTDPRGLVTRTSYNAAGWVTQTVENYVDGTPSGDTDKTTKYVYNAGGLLTQYRAATVGGADQITAYSYGVGTIGGLDDVSAAASKELLRQVTRPAGMGPEQAEWSAYNALGQPVLHVDRNGVYHASVYDVLGRRTADEVTAGTSGTVRRIETGYDGQGHAARVTEYTNAQGVATAGVASEVVRTFTGLGQLEREYQAVGGAVTTATLNVQYTYSTLDGSNRSRPTGLVYPSGGTVTYNYASGLDSDISRLTSIGEGTVTLERYSYLGLSTVVKASRPQPGVGLTYVRPSGDTTTVDGGDQYTGLDRFGRVVAQLWRDGSDSIIVGNKYSYDADGNRLYKTDEVNHAFDELYHASGSTAGYDGLNQLTAFLRGTLSDANSDGVYDTVASASATQGWTFDGLGNATSAPDGPSGSVTQSFNAQNQLTERDGNALDYDSEGNTITDEHGHTLTYDAWNRLVGADTGSATTTYVYDGLGRRVREVTATSSGAETRTLVYSAGWQVLEERVGTSSPTVDTKYVWGARYVDEMVLRDRDSDANGTLDKRLYAVQDANWNVTAVMNASGVVQERYVSSPYGAFVAMNAALTATTSLTLGWKYVHQGLRYDAVLEMYENRARIYDPVTGRFMQVDPKGFGAGDSDLYRYENSNAISNLDPSGKAKIIDPSVNIPANGKPPTVLQQLQDMVRRKCGEAGKKYLEQALGHITSIYQATFFPWERKGGFWGQCSAWAERFNSIEKNNAVRPMEKAKSDWCFKIDVVYWTNWYGDKFGKSGGPDLQDLSWWTWGGPIIPLVRRNIDGAGHAAVRITFRDGTVVYFDDGNRGGDEHAFRPDQVPSHYVPDPDLHRLPTFEPVPK